MFLASCIQVKFSAANGDQEDFCIQLSLDDIINIESWWIGAVSCVLVFQYLLIHNSLLTYGRLEKFWVCIWISFLFGNVSFFPSVW